MQKTYFPNASIEESGAVKITATIRAENGAQVPFAFYVLNGVITSTMPWTWPSSTWHHEQKVSSQCYDSKDQEMRMAPGGGISAALSFEEGAQADAWAANIWADVLS